MVRHVVVWSMKPEAAAELDSLLADLRELPDRIEEIRALSAGPLLNDSPFDAALCVDVDDREALERYRSHPAHQPSLQRLRQLAGEILAADYEL